MLYAVDLQESPTVQTLPKISKYTLCNNIVIDGLFYIKCQLKTVGIYTQ
jgi:hypothetical protein